MEKRYQVFVSSTYADLVDERRRVIQTLMEMDCIPAGMELFPATDEEQWQFIKRVITDCDYYLLIIGGRYGSTTADGVSYTEKEYDYAIELGLKVVAFVHENPDEIPVGKSDINPEARARLAAFREKVTAGRLVKFWKTAAELPGLVALSLSHTIKVYPAVGWVRANQIASADAVNDVNSLLKRTRELEAALAAASAEPTIDNLAGFEERVEMHGRRSLGGTSSAWSVTSTWAELFALIAPYLLAKPTDMLVKADLTSSLHKKNSPNEHHRYYTIYLDDQDFQTVKVQLMALRLVNVDYLESSTGGWELFWSLTPRGEAKLMDLRTVKKTAS